MDYKKQLIDLLQGITTWPELKAKLEIFNTSKTYTTEKNTIAGKLFEYFAKYYFKVDATQSQLYTDVWLYEEIDSLIKEELGLPNIDKGVDLLLKDTQGRYTVVQCKFKNNEESIVHFGKDKLANTFFWSKKCFGVILFTNVADCTDDIKNEKNFNAIKSDTLLNIDSSVFSAIINYIQSNTPPLVKKHEPQPHQELAIMEVVKHFETNDRGQLILPCGAGKTTTSLWIKESLKSKSTLVLFPSLALLRQFKTEWAEQRSEDYIYINICSEKDIDKNKDDSPVMHTYEISGEVTTSSERVKEFLTSEFEQKIVFSTYQSIGVVQGSLLQMPDFFFDLIICDEAHRTSGGAKKNTFAIVHDQTKIRGKKRLYMTATPRVVSVQLKAKLGKDYALLCDMSNPEIYGEEAFRMSFGEAITQNILVDYKIVGIGVTQKQVKQFIEQRRYVTEEYDLKEIADNYALNLVMDKYSAFHAITFHSRVKFAEEFSKRHNSYFGADVYSSHVSGEDKTSKRADILRRFKNHDKGVVSNARCLTEGVDVPIIDLIYFCDPKNSKIDIVQASGRALRKDRHGKKPIGYIVVPIFHLINDDIEKEIENNPYFKNLIQVVRSLCDQDERLQAEIDEVAFSKGERISKRIEITYDDNEIDKIISLEGMDKEIKRYLFDQIIEKTRDSWNLMYANLVEFKKIYSTTNISRKHIEYKTLKWWVQTQRDSYFKKKLSQSQIDKLNRIGFEWKGEQRREITDRFEIWMRSYRKLQIYFTENGNTDIPAMYKKDKSLGAWVVEQRIRYDKGKLSDEQIELLENIKINWDPKNTYPELIESLIEYKKVYLNVNVPQGKYEYRKIAAKCARARSIYKNGTETIKGDIIAKGKGRITKWAIEKLTELGFEWNVGTPDWDERFEDLKKYYEVNVQSSVKASENQNLFFWCYRQRKNRDELEPEQIQKLQSINFIFEIKKSAEENAFIEKLSTLKEYYDNISAGNTDFEKALVRKIQKWESAFRIAYKEDILPADKFDMLNDINFSFLQENLDDKAWEENYNSLSEFYNEYQSFIIPDEYEFEKLKRWIQYQRGLYKKNKLREDRIERLLSIGYDFLNSYKSISAKTKESISNTYWQKKINELKTYLITYERIDGIEKREEFKPLYSWIKRAKAMYKKDELSETKIHQLREVGFDFNYKPIREKIEKEDNWIERFKELKEHFVATGNFYLSMKNAEQKKLTSWLRSQRSLYKQDELSEERTNQLLNIGFSFVEKYGLKKNKGRKEIDKEKWNENFEQFKIFYTQNGAYYILISDSQNKQLRVWLQSQIAKYRRHKLSPEQIEKFTSIGFTFQTNQITKARPVRAIKEKKDLEAIWNKHYLSLVDYKIRNGDCNVPRGYIDKALGNWVSRQRYLKKLKELAKVKIDKLDLIGFQWGEMKGISEFELWMKTYYKLKSFFENNGYSSPKKSYGDKQLVSWIFQQRHRKRKNKLKKEYFDLLEEIKFVWNPDLTKTNDVVWLSNYKKLIEYKEKFGNTNVSQSNKEYKFLGKWVNDQRYNFKKDKMSEFRIGKLHEVGFVWDARFKH